MSLDKEQIENLSELLLSSEDVNTNIAFEILEQHEFPLELLTEVFAIFKISKNKPIKNRAKKILETHGSDELHMAMKLKYALGSNNSDMGATEKTIKKNIIMYVHNNELDGIKLAKALYKKFGFGATYLLTATPQEQRKEMLKTFISGTSFQLNKKALTKFPPEIFEFPELTSIDLSNNKITSIPKQIEVFKNLKELNLGNNKLKSIHKNVLKLKGLEVLMVNDNNFVQKNFEMIFEMPQLKRLNLINVKGNWSARRSLPDGFFNMKELEELQLAKGRFRTYDNFPQIAKVTGNPIDLDPLAAAYAAYDQGDKSPVSYIFKFGNSENILKILNDHFDASTGTMDFTNIYLEHLPAEMAELDVQHLNLRGCKLGAVYSGGHVKSNEQLTAEDLERTAVLGQMKTLRSLNLFDNVLSGLSDLSELQELKVLNLLNNEFRCFPYGYFGLSNLEELYLQRATHYYHELTADDIPTELKNLTGLKKIQFGSIRGIKKGEYLCDTIIRNMLPSDCEIMGY